MHIKVKLYKDKNDDGELHFIEKGIGEIYDPEMKGSLRSNSIIGPHVTLKIGKYRIQINKEDFIQFAKKILFSKSF